MEARAVVAAPGVSASPCISQAGLVKNSTFGQKWARLQRVADFEHDLIGARTTERRNCAKSRGVRMRRLRKLTDHLMRGAIKCRDHGAETLAEIGRSHNVTGWTISRLTV
jgi:hypothetical protein